jgi:hypothetical protein
VLEQRIGRVHRMGQSRGVQVINFVGQGAIEEGMLSVLAFKTSLFAGVLDGGASEVFLQGTKLSQFMKSVEEVAGAMGAADADAEAEPIMTVPPVMSDTPANTAAPRATAAAFAAVGPLVAPVVTEATAETADLPAPTPAADPWAAILEAGAALLQGMAATRSTGAAPFSIERDPVTGQASVRLPLPEPAVLKRLAQAFEPWLK